MAERDVPRLPDPALVIVQHSGLPNGHIQARIADLRVLLDAGLIEATDAKGTTFRVTPAGNASYDEVLSKEKPR